MVIGLNISILTYMCRKTASSVSLLTLIHMRQPLKLSSLPLFYLCGLSKHWEVVVSCFLFSQWFLLISIWCWEMFMGCRWSVQKGHLMSAQPMVYCKWILTTVAWHFGALFIISLELFFLISPYKIHHVLIDWRWGVESLSSVYIKIKDLKLSRNFLCRSTFDVS